MFSSLCVCLSVSKLRKNFRTDLHEIFREGWQRANEQIITFRWLFGSPSVYKDFFVFRIRHYWEIRKAVNGHKSAAHTDFPDGGTGKTYLGGGMQCLCF